MRLQLFLLSIAVPASLAGCAIYPVPENVAGYDVFEIERHIRCETQAAVQDKAIALLEASPYAATKAMALQLRQNRSLFKKFTRLKFDPTVAPYIEKYANTAVGYEFTFDATEDNEADGQVDFLAAISGGAVKLGVKAMNDRSREGITHFQASDVFGKLIGDEIPCNPAMNGANFIYPITGSIGIWNPIRQFIDLNEFGNLAGDKVPTYTATFNFQTTVSGSLTPQVTLSPVVHGVADAMLNGSAKRVDQHKLILGLSLPPAKGTAGAHGVPAAVTIGAFGLAGTQLYANKTPAELRALSAIQDSKVDRFLDKGAIVVPQ